MLLCLGSIYDNCFSDLDRAHRHIDRLVASLPSHLTSVSFSSYQLIQMVAINLFAMHHARHKLDGEGNSKKGPVEKLSQDEEKSYEKVFTLTGMCYHFFAYIYNIICCFWLKLDPTKNK